MSVSVAPQTTGPDDASGAASLAVAQRSVRDATITYPLWPPLTEGCPRSSGTEVQYPLEIAYDLQRVDPTLFDQPALPGLHRWAPVLPPLAPGLDLGVGGTPLVPVPELARFARFDGELYMKDETRNPTWSHKDRLNTCAVSAAVLTGAPGVVVASPGNHGASAAAHAAAAGLPCIVVATAGGPDVGQRFVDSYGAAVVAVDRDDRWPVVRDIVDKLGFHPVSNLTITHTGHPFGPEGYKTIAFEIFGQLGRRVPSAVLVPTGYAEALYGIWKGFVELQAIGVTSRLPRMVACEPAARGPLHKALREGSDATHVPTNPTRAFSIGSTTSGYRGVVAIRDSGGTAILLTEDELEEAHQAQRRAGFWHELSSGAGLAALRQLFTGARRGDWADDGPVVFVSTSSGFKDHEEHPREITISAPDWASVREHLKTKGIAT
ncbi:threonine synthase [Jiangella asiatica]|uniref:Pyridoxal-phosphate dependent enzyme n=1 Tax=Jiangella asiatica TaxID=2530372 RepID=A0A4R5DN88_9ACTN|nr:pyridoxal-phosphate dependent enzyme [Jiangella asiatica]TDE12173.1 pyridoxal-phosphate dependent enzyme [Jiangella asiatica]